MEKLLDLIKEHNWLLICKSYTPQKIARKLSFEESMKLAYQMFNNEAYDDDVYNFAVDILLEIRETFSYEWEKDWRNDFLLGDACQFTMRFNESYAAYKKASLKLNTDLPPSLLISLAGCYLSPNKPISIEEAERLVKAALEKEKSIEAVVLIRGICKTQDREEEFNYWSNILEELEKQGAYMKNEWPKWLLSSN